MTCNKLFKEYKKYFSGDELALSNNTLYYNICMNKAGVYTFLDSSVLFSDVNNVYNNYVSIAPLTFIRTNKDILNKLV